MLADVIPAVILFLAVAFWELPVSLVPSALCFSMPRKLVLPTLVAVLTAGLVLGVALGDDSRMMLDVSSASIPVAVGSAFAVVLILRLLSMHAAFIPALSAAIIGSQLYNGVADPDLVRIPLQWLGAMLLAAVLGMLIYRLMDRALSNSSTHLLVKLSVLGTLMSVSVLVMMMAAGMNLSGLIRFSFPEGISDVTRSLPSIAAAVLAVLAFSPALKREVLRLADDAYDADAAVSVSCVAACAITMILMVRCTVISPMVVMLSAFAGAKAVRWRELLSSVILAPAFALLLSFTVSAIIASAASADPLNVAEAVAGLLAIVCCALAALLVRAGRSRPSPGRDTSSEISEGFRRLNEMKVHSMQVENEYLQNLLEIRRRDAMSIAERISEQSSFIDDIYARVTEAEMTADVDRKDELLHALKSSLNLRRNFQDDRTDFYNKVESLHQDFSARLTQKCPQFSSRERELATLLRLEFSSKYIAALMNISPKSVEVERHRLRKKLGLSRDQNLIDYIKNI